MEEVLT